VSEIQGPRQDLIDRNNAVFQASNGAARMPLSIGCQPNGPHMMTGGPTCVCGASESPVIISRAEYARLTAQAARADLFRVALEQIHNASGAYISASSVYGDTDDIGLWKEIHTTARMALDQIGDVVK